MLDLGQIRQEIDQIDQDLVLLLERRMALVDQVIAYKKGQGMAVLDTDREQAVLERVSQRVQTPAYRKTVRDTFSAIMAHSRAYQEGQLDDTAQD